MYKSEGIQVMLGIHIKTRVSDNRSLINMPPLVVYSSTVFITAHRLRSEYYKFVIMDEGPESICGNFLQFWKLMEALWTNIR